MECKFLNKTPTLTEVLELIDTLWNVNIDYWIDEYGFRCRINRYIMECKYLVYNYKHKEGCSELIDTLWNVNVFITCSSFNKYAN